MYVWNVHTHAKILTVIITFKKIGVVPWFIFFIIVKKKRKLLICDWIGCRGLMNFYVLSCQRWSQSSFNQIKTFKREALVLVSKHFRLVSDFFYFKHVLNLILILLQASLVYEIQTPIQLLLHDVSSKA